MHPGLLKEIVQLCRRRLAAGDHPTESVADAEVLENAIVQLADQLAIRNKLLARYRDETPIGHQPHMLAGEVDIALERT